MALWHLQKRFGDLCLFSSYSLTTGLDSEPPRFGHEAGTSLKACELFQVWLLGSEADVLLIIYIAWPTEVCVNRSGHHRPQRDQSPQ